MLTFIAWPTCDSRCNLYLETFELYVMANQLKLKSRDKKRIKNVRIDSDRSLFRLAAHSTLPKSTDESTAPSWNHAPTQSDPVRTDCNQRSRAVAAGRGHLYFVTSINRNHRCILRRNRKLLRWIKYAWWASAINDERLIAWQVDFWNCIKGTKTSYFPILFSHFSMQLARICYSRVMSSTGGRF